MQKSAKADGEMEPRAAWAGRGSGKISGRQNGSALIRQA